MTRGENVRHSFALGLNTRAKGEKSSVAKLTDAQAEEIRHRYRYYDRASSQYVLAREFGVSQGTISAIIRGATYGSGHVSPQGVTS